MNWGVNRYKLLFIAVILPLAFFACTKKAHFPNCKSNEDCRVDATGKTVNGVCHMGKCEECAEDSDCKDLKQCVNNRCEKMCQADADCGPNMHCQDSSCVNNCVADSDCMGDRVCAQGRCVAELMVGKDIYAQLGDECQGLELIHFDFDRFNIKPEYTAHVEKLARCLEANPAIVLSIEGHTDDRGTPAYNMALSERRANAVKEFLVNVKGIAKDRLHTVSYGETMPLMSGQNEQAWSQNRRAAFDLKGR